MILVSFSFIINDFSITEYAMNPTGNVVSGQNSIGYASPDADGKAALSNFGYTGSFAFDYDQRSIGVDLGSIKSVNSATLTGTFLNSGTMPMISQIQLYYSNDNVQWNLLSYSSSTNVLVITFTFSSVQARYIKIHSTSTSINVNYGNTNLQNMIAVSTTSLNTCTDTDATQTNNGIYAAGYIILTSPGGNVRSDDSCNSAGKLIEQICTTENGQAIGTFTEVICPVGYVCSSGRCTQQTQNKPPAPTLTLSDASNIDPAVHAFWRLPSQPAEVIGVGQLQIYANAGRISTPSADGTFSNCNSPLGLQWSDYDRTQFGCTVPIGYSSITEFTERLPTQYRGQTVTYFLRINYIKDNGLINSEWSTPQYFSVPQVACIPITWSPDTFTTCPSNTLTQTSNCNTQRTVSGTKTCFSGQTCNVNYNQCFSISSTQTPVISYSSGVLNWFIPSGSKTVNYWQILRNATPLTGYVSNCPTGLYYTSTEQSDWMNCYTNPNSSIVSMNIAPKTQILTYTVRAVWDGGGNSELSDSVSAPSIGTTTPSVVITAPNHSSVAIADLQPLGSVYMFRGITYTSSNLQSGEYIIKFTLNSVESSLSNSLTSAEPSATGAFSISNPTAGALTIVGKLYKNGQLVATSNTVTMTLISGQLQNEIGLCRNAIDDDKDGMCDYDGLNCPNNPEGDSDCPVSVTKISVNNANPVINTEFTVTCESNIANIRSIGAKIGTTNCRWIPNSWNGNTVQFACNAGAVGTKTVECFIDQTLSTQSGANKQATINVQASSGGDSFSCPEKPREFGCAGGSDPTCGAGVDLQITDLLVTQDSITGSQSSLQNRIVDGLNIQIDSKLTLLAKVPGSMFMGVNDHQSDIVLSRADLVLMKDGKEIQRKTITSQDIMTKPTPNGNGYTCTELQPQDKYIKIGEFIPEQLGQITISVEAIASGVTDTNYDNNKKSLNINVIEKKRSCSYGGGYYDSDTADQFLKSEYLCYDGIFYYWKDASSNYYNPFPGSSVASRCQQIGSWYANPVTYKWTRGDVLKDLICNPTSISFSSPVKDSKILISSLIPHPQNANNKIINTRLNRINLPSNVAKIILNATKNNILLGQKTTLGMYELDYPIYLTNPQSGVLTLTATAVDSSGNLVQGISPATINIILTTETLQLKCGNNICDNGETIETCKEDCGTDNCYYPGDSSIFGGRHDKLSYYISQDLCYNGRFFTWLRGAYNIDNVNAKYCQQVGSWYANPTIAGTDWINGLASSNSECSKPEPIAITPFIPPVNPPANEFYAKRPVESNGRIEFIANKDLQITWSVSKGTITQNGIFTAPIVTATEEIILTVTALNPTRSKTGVITIYPPCALPQERDTRDFVCKTKICPIGATPVQYSGSKIIMCEKSDICPQYDTQNMDGFNEWNSKCGPNTGYYTYYVRQYYCPRGTQPINDIGCKLSSGQICKTDCLVKVLVSPIFP